MNRKEIRERVERELVFSPDIEAHRDDLNAVINDVYQELMVEERWLFRQKTFTFRAYADYEFTFSRQEAVGTPIIEEQFKSVGSFDTYERVHLWQDLVGHRIEFTRYAGAEEYWTLIPLTILGFDDVWNTQPPSVFVYYWDNDALGHIVGPNWGVPIDATVALIELTARFDRYRLPVDCAEVLGVVDREDERELFGVNLARERGAALDFDETGTPSHYLFTPPTHHRTAFTRTAGVAGAGQVLYNHSDKLVDSLPPIYGTFSAAASTDGSNSLLPSTTYEYMIVLEALGMVSPPGEIVRVTTGPTDDTVDLTGIPTFPDNLARKAIFRRKAEGRWVLAGLIPFGGSTFTDTGAVDENTGFADLGERLFYESFGRDGVYQFIRLWPKPEENRDYEVRYLSSPAKMTDDLMVPEMPSEFQHLIVHRALVRLGTRYNATEFVRSHARKDQEITVRMRRRYLHAQEQTRRRRSFWNPNTRVRPFRLEFDNS